jgi:uncharacterized membrane protein
MFFEDWLHRKAEENAHNEILAFLLMVLGMNLLMGGLLMSLIVAGELTVVLQPSSLPPSFTAYSGFILTVVGFLVMFSGFTLTIYYSRKRLWFISEIERSTLRMKIPPKTANTILDEYAGKRKREEH